MKMGNIVISMHNDMHIYAGQQRSKMILFNGYEIKPTIFPDKTSQVWKLPLELFQESAAVEWYFESESELIHLAQLKDLIDRYSLWPSTLIIHYLPYARQDKRVNNDATFALTSFARLLNAINFSEVRLIDPHSECAKKLINGSFDVYPIQKVINAYRATKAQLVCYPDEGAVEKYKRVYAFNYVWGKKTRDALTGQIISYALNLNGRLIKGKNVLIIDDICDGGTTFVNLSRLLYKGGAHKVYLFVTHGLFTKGKRILHQAGIKKIFTKESVV